jgi:integrase
MKNNGYTKTVSNTSICNGPINNKSKSTTATTIAAKYDNEIIKRKFEIVTEGLGNYYVRFLTQRVSIDNALTIADYLIAMRAEINLSDHYRKTAIQSLGFFSKFHNNKLFKHMKREDILSYLDSFRKSESSDQLHRWVGTYNLYRILILRFLKWLYQPGLKPGERKTPALMENIPALKRKEQSVYKPTDLWSTTDDALFLKYCPSKRDRCYHTIARDSSCRPSEILSLKIKSLVFRSTGEHQYAEILVNGKTGTRHIPLINSIPHLKDWLDSHPQRGNSNAFLICSLSHRSFGKHLMVNALRHLYRDYKLDFFPKLIDDPMVPAEDKQKIGDLLQKPWNPYIRRHSALTEKSTFLKEHILRQHAGWSGRSQMHLKYLHYFGNESNESILEAYGIVTKDRQQLDVLKPKQCPNCNEPNKPDSKFCAKCRMVLTYDAYNETLEKQQKKETEVQELKERHEQDMKAMREEMENKFQQMLTRIDMAKLG